MYLNLGNSQILLLRRREGEMRLSKKAISIIISLIALLSLAIFLYRYLTGYQYITITTNPSIESVIITISPEDSLEKNTTLKYGEKNRVKKGSHILTIQGSEIQTVKKRVNLTDSPLVEEVYISYSKEQLDKILRRESRSIRKVIERDVPAVKNPIYVIEDEKLYRTGEWYSAIITKNTEQTTETYSDRFKVILQKKEGSWKVITNPPDIVISQELYPNIPREILIAVNGKDDE